MLCGHFEEFHLNEKIIIFAIQSSPKFTVNLKVLTKSIHPNNLYTFQYVKDFEIVEPHLNLQVASMKTRNSMSTSNTHPPFYRLIGSNFKNFMHMSRMDQFSTLDTDIHAILFHNITVAASFIVELNSIPHCRSCQFSGSSVQSRFDSRRV
mmetsp:Transcript_7274/g.14934  ORF Transcript_7274/g.14934 Transcript_7274/m.14934 type:complete len:151 (+) Transcript_7274:56-508(+)